MQNKRDKSVDQNGKAVNDSAVEMWSVGCRAAVEAVHLRGGTVIHFTQCSVSAEK